MISSSRSWACIALVGLFGCSPNVPTVTRPIPITAVFDLATSNIPSPNDLALDDAGIVAIAQNDALSEAENDLKRSFNGHNGFSAGSSARVTFGAPLSAASLTDKTVVAFDLGLNRAGPVTAFTVNRAYTDCDRAVTMTSPTGFVPGHTYLFAVRGGDAGVRGVNDEEVVEAPLFHYLRAGKDLRQHADALPGATRAEREAIAEKLEGVRQQLEPLFQILENEKLPRREVVSMWHFTVHTQGELYFDPGSKQLPFPNDLLKDPRTGLVAIPIDPTEKPEAQALKKTFNTLDGFSTTAPLYFTSTATIDRNTATPATVRLFERDTGKEFTDISRVVSVDARRLVITPLSPLAPATAYVVVVNGLKDVRTNTFAAMPLSAALSLGKPLVDGDNQSTVSSFCADTAARLESIRSGIANVLTKASLPVTGPAFDAAGKPNPLTSLTYQFTTQDIMKRAREEWLTPYEKNLPVTVRDLSSQSGTVLELLNGILITTGKVDKVYAGKFATWDRLDPSTRAFRENGAGVQRDIPFTLSVPKGAGAKTKIAVFGHGLYTEKRLMYFVAEALADKGYAAMAIDFPYHGDRTVCLKETHFIVPVPMCPNGATCSDDGHCIKDGMEVPLVQGDLLQMMAQLFGAPVPAISTIGLDIPAGTGQPWIDVENLGGTRDHFRQAIIDLSAQTRLIKQADWKSILGGNISFDPDNIYWTGISLGGIMGSVVSSIDPSYKAMLLNVPGGDLPNLMLDSNMFSGTLINGLKAKGIVEGSAEWDSFLGAAHWILDEIDPINIIPYAKSGGWKTVDPVTLELKSAPAKRIRIQMALNDTVVPNSSTASLVKAGKIDKSTEYREFVGTHIFLADPFELTARIPGLNDMVDFLDGKK